MDARRRGWSRHRTASREDRNRRGCGNEEAALMVTEKIRAMLEVQVRLATGSFGPTALGNVQGVTSHYRKRVLANSRRLSR